MARFELSPRKYRDQVYACWLGKNIGGTLGAPYEGQKHVHSLTFYHPVPKEAAANDDLDLQLIWLKLLEDKGTDPPLPCFAEYWTKYAAAYPWNEYGFAHRNLSRGLMPPISGCFENYFVDEMGSPIRSEIWACACPADPQLAASLAWKDSAIDHAGGEGTYGEMFWAAVQSAAFVESDPLTLIRIGLSMIPISSHISRAIREAVWCWQRGLLWAEARERIASRFGHLQPCNAIPNHGFIILGWLYGEDFGDKLCKAVNCGYDTDCTGATLGALLGILGGPAGIPEKWRKPVGEQIVLHKFTGDCNAPKTIVELTDRTVNVARKMVAERSDAAAFLPDGKDGGAHILPADAGTSLFRNVLARRALANDPQSAVMLDENGSGVEIVLHYMGDPVLWPEIGREMEVSLRKGGEAAGGEIGLSAPESWTVKPLGKRSAPDGERSRFLVTARTPEGRNKLRVTARVAEGGAKGGGRGKGKAVETAASFTILGPDEAKGFPAGDNVRKCPKCAARIEACICPVQRSCS
ncbi:MAG: ADP-ribosylglycohydrolase family protein [Planctomycetota bacterium]|nr:ADP-ribosylglycohydrolase family protein [Planctomycetota bacterium]